LGVKKKVRVAIHRTGTGRFSTKWRFGNHFLGRVSILGHFIPVEAVDPIPSILDRDGVLILDGGLGSELERRGHDLNHQLWSARLLIDQPEALREVHLAYARAGAGMIVTASYQATFEGFARCGVDVREATRLFAESVELAQVSAEIGRRVLVAASIGPWGAFAADGGEYRGKYGLTVQQLLAWHRPRVEALQETSADLLAFETIPSLEEVEAIAELLDAFGHVRAWISFSCRDAELLADGSPLEKAVELVGDHPQIVAIGFNCVPPSRVSRLAARIRATTNKPVLANPNSGESFDLERRIWRETRGPDAFANEAAAWTPDVQLLGGCCGTTPEHIAVLRDRLG
jgi:homocysteine S-methyltransferase